MRTFATKGHAALKGWSLIFYGTTQPIEKNDPVSVRLEPNSSVSANKYPIIVMPKPAVTGGFNAAAAAAAAAAAGGQSAKGAGRKQQQNQKQSASSATSSSVGPAQRKPLKQQKNNAKKQQQQQQRFSTSSTTTMRPVNPMPSYNRYTPAEKMRTYNLADYLASLNAAAAAAGASATGTSTARPAAANGKQYANNVDAYDKVPAVKAPKQVKQVAQVYGTPAAAQNSAKAASSTVLSSSGAMTALTVPAAAVATTTPRPNIPKMFQNYEKVQEFYPEFQAYEGPTRSSTRQLTRRPMDQGSFISSNSGGGGSGGVLMSAGYALNGGHKPSRENAKKLFFTDHNTGITVSKKNSTQILLVRSPDIGRSDAVQNETGQKRNE